MNKKIIEEKLGIPPDYQYRALNSKNFLQANWHSNKLHVLRKLLPFTKEDEVLNLGTGSGNFELSFAKEVKKIVGIDYNSKAILFLNNQLKKRGIKNVKLVTADIKSLQKLNNLGKFNYILIIDTLEHVRINEADKVIIFLKTFLKPKGKICIITPNYDSSWRIIEPVLDRVTIIPKLAGEQHLAKYTHKNLSRLFNKNNYKEEKISSFNLLSYFIPNKKISNYLTELEIKMPLNLGSLLVGIFHY